MSYEQGFTDALDMVEAYVEDYGIEDPRIKKIIEDLRKAMREEKINKLKYKLGLSRVKLP